MHPKSRKLFLRKAYRYIAAEDCRLKSEETYLREKGAFSGFTLDIARELAELIEIKPVDLVNEKARTRERVVTKTRYLIPYRVRGDVVEILRVFHASRRTSKRW